MSLGTWEPGADATALPVTADDETLARLAGYSRDQQLDRLEELIPVDERQRLAGLMKLDAEAWMAAAASLDEERLLHLIRFFAVAENLPGWEAGPGSPVIPLARTLRQRGRRLDKTLLQWLREVSDNRFLPYGPL
jgi:hypothetical protein